MNNLKDSFTQVLIPNVYKIGYYQEKGNDYKYPLFVSMTEDRYVLDPNGTIYVYKSFK